MCQVFHRANDSSVSRSDVIPMRHAEEMSQINYPSASIADLMIIVVTAWIKQSADQDQLRMCSHALLLRLTLSQPPHSTLYTSRSHRARRRLCCAHKHDPRVWARDSEFTRCLHDLAASCVYAVECHSVTPFPYSGW